MYLFNLYDQDGSCALKAYEFKQMMMDLDQAHEQYNSDPRFKERYDVRVMKEFDKADIAGNHLISVDEFYLYYYQELCFKFPMDRSLSNPGAALYNVFVKYASYGTNDPRAETMQSFQFIKLCEDCKFVPLLPRSHADLIFARARAETAHLEGRKVRHGAHNTARIQYEQFLFCLLRLGEKRKSGFQEVVTIVLSYVDARPSASCADLLVFTNTGPEEEEYQEMEFLERPRGLPPQPRGPALGRASTSIRRSLQSKVLEEAAQHSSHRYSAVDDSQDLAAYAGQGFTLPPQQRPHSAAGSLQRPPTNLVTITPLTPDGQPRSSRPASASSARGSRAADEQVVVEVRSTRGSRAASAAGSLKGRLEAGAKAEEAEELARKNEAGLRNAEILEAMALTPEGELISGAQKDKWGFGDTAYRLKLEKEGPGALHNPNVLWQARTANLDDLIMAAKRVYARYCKWQGGLNNSAMDSSRFFKVLRDINCLSERGPLTGKKADKIFHSCVPAGKTCFNFVDFLEALRYIALEFRISLNEVLEKIVIIGSPQL